MVLFLVGSIGSRFDSRGVINLFLLFLGYKISDAGMIVIFLLEEKWNKDRSVAVGYSPAG